MCFSFQKESDVKIVQDLQQNKLRIYTYDDWITATERIASVSIWTIANGVVIYNFAFSIETTSARTWVYAFLIDTSFR